MVGLVVTRWSTLLVVLVGWRLAIGTSSLRRVSRRSLLRLLGLLLIALLLAIASLLSLVSRLLLAISCWLGVVILVVTSRLAVGIVTDRDRDEH